MTTNYFPESWDTATITTNTAGPEATVPDDVLLDQYQWTLLEKAAWERRAGMMEMELIDG